MSNTLMEGLRQRLGIAENADEATLLAAVDEALAEQADPPRAGGQATLQLPEGIVTVERSVLEQLSSDAQLGRQAHERQQAEHRDRVLQTALSTGRISPANREHFSTLLQADPEGTERALMALPEGLIPVTKELGHDQAGAAETASVDTVRASASYQNWSF